MHRIREAIVVEGRYDKNTLMQIVDAPVIQTDGFGIFKNKEQLNLLRKIAQTRGLIVLTDSDGAGFVIRNYLKGAISPQYLKHAYVPDIHGKERRKATAGKEGLLGVEGMRPAVIVDALRRAGATFLDEPTTDRCEITKQDMAELGLSGGPSASLIRKKLCRELEFPEHMSANALLQALNLLYSKTELAQIVQNLE